jgi:ABC-type nitrate/sulfonate/bicarbonate transport system ATPase subunit
MKMEPSTSLIVDIKTFKFSKNEKNFFENIELTLNAKELNFLIGMSGSGKTTFLNIILGIYNDNIESEICFKTNGEELDFLDSKKKGLIGFISQSPSLVPWETIIANIEIPSKLNRNLKLPSLYEIIQELVSVGLDESILGLFPHQLSFGMQSRISIVRTLLYKPKFLFLDELFTGIDTINSNLIATRLKSYIKINHAVCLSITHDIDRAVNLATSIYLLNKSQKLHKISPVFNTETIINFINTN